MKTISQLREERGWTQLKLANAIGVTPTTIYNWERGTYEPKASQLRILAQLFDTRMDDIEFVEVEGDMSTLEAQFRQDFHQYLNREWRASHPNSVIKPSADTPHPMARNQGWMAFLLQRRGFRLFWQIGTESENKYVAAGLILQGDGVQCFEKLKQHKDAISAEIGWPLEWTDYPPDKDGQLYMSLNNRTMDPTDHEQWPTHFRWLCEQLERSFPVFRKYIDRVQPC